MRIKLAAGNWKMNGVKANLDEISALNDLVDATKCEVLICAPATLISRMVDLTSKSELKIGGQDCHSAENGAHTGDTSAAMLADAGAQYVILGHSERRADHGESDTLINEKTKTAIKAGLRAIVCVGETLDEREASNTLDIIGGQLAASIPDGIMALELVVAYEPVWAIGTGLTPTLGQIGEVHDFIRYRLERRFGEGIGRSIRIIYGGSMNPKNVQDIIGVSNVDGGLVGGASLKAADFSVIVDALS